MAIEKRYADQPLQVVDTPENLERIERIAAAEGVSKASVCRDLHARSLSWREERSRRLFPEAWPSA